MRDKNIRRAAHALFLSQGDDKNDLLVERIPDKAARKRVKDQGRAIVVIEKLLLPYGKDSYTEEEMYETILRKLVKKGHRIQGDEEEDTEQYLEEKRKAMVPSIWLDETLTVEDILETEDCQAPETVIEVPGFWNKVRGCFRR